MRIIFNKLLKMVLILSKITYDIQNPKNRSTIGGITLKRLFCAITVAALLWLMTGCGSSPSSNRYIEAAEPTVEPTVTASEAAVQTEDPQAEPTQANAEQTESAQPEPTQQGEKTEEQSTEKPKDPGKKQTKAEKVQEAKKNNEAVAKAVTDSIMDNGENKAAASGPEVERLKKAIEDIRGLVKDLKQHAENDDAEKMKEVSSQIVQDWDAMKADVDASYPDMTDFLQEKIVKLNELLTAETIDSQAMLQLDYELYQAFRQLADKAGV
jgi:DNA polymerase III gamma/tau subunit